MRKILRMSAAALCLAAGAPIAMAVGAGSAWAQKQSVGAKVGKPLQEAQALAQKGKFSEALVKAKEAEALESKTPYEEFVVKDFLAYLYVQLRDYGNAAAAYEAAFATGQAPADQKALRLKTLTQLYYQSKSYAKTISYGERYLQEIGQDDDVSALVCQSYYLQKNYAKALELSERLIRSAEQRGRRPDEGALQILLSSAYQLKNSALSRTALMKLVEHYPSADYWSDLLNTMNSQTGLTERTSLEIFRLKSAVGALAEPEEFVEMAELALLLGLPGEAQRVMERGFAAGTLGADPATSTREQRLLRQSRTDAAADKATLASQAAQVSASAIGEDDVKLAEAYETYGDNETALRLLDAGLAAGGVKSLDLAQLTRGRVLFNLGRSEEARAAFAAVSGDPIMGEIAKVWIIRSRAAA